MGDNYCEIEVVREFSSENSAMPERLAMPEESVSVVLAILLVAVLIAFNIFRKRWFLRLLQELG